MRAALEFVDDRGHRDAAQIAYFALLSFIPLGLLLVGAFGLVFDDTEVRERVVNTVFDNVPLARGEDRAQLERTVGDALDRARPPRRGLDPAADRRRQRRHGRVAPRDQRGVGHPHAPAAAPAQGARRRARARRDRRARAVALADRDATARRRGRDEAEGGSVAAALLDAVGDALPLRVHRDRGPLPLPRAAVAAAEDAGDLAGRGRRRAAARRRARGARAVLRGAVGLRRALRLARRR